MPIYEYKEGQRLARKSFPDRMCLSGTGICTLDMSVQSTRVWGWHSAAITFIGASWDPVMHTDLKIKASYEVNKALKGTEIFESDLDAPGDRWVPTSRAYKGGTSTWLQVACCKASCRPAAEEHVGRWGSWPTGHLLIKTYFLPLIFHLSSHQIPVSPEVPVPSAAFPFCTLNILLIHFCTKHFQNDCHGDTSWISL